MNRHFITALLINILCWTVLFAQHPTLREIYQFSGWQEGLYLGHSLLNAGDINNDGFEDYISFAPVTGTAFFFWGNFPVDTVPALTFIEYRGQFPKHADEMAVIDLDNDSLPELIMPFRGPIETSIHRLSETMDSIPDYRLPEGGQHIATGDFNGDGFNDIAVSSISPVTQMRGRIAMFWGGAVFDTIPDFIFHGDSAWHQLGAKLSGGDFNGDGYSDLAVWHREAIPDTDYVRIYMGSMNFDSIPDFNLKDPSVTPGNVGFTNFWLNSFDYNLDGYDDLFVGGFFIYNGGAVFDTIPEYHMIWPDSSFNAYAGARVFNAGDINKDGWPDLAIGMPNMFGSNGLVHVRLGGNRGFDENYIIMEPVPPVTSRFGSGIINIGDLDNNGDSDLLIGAPFYTLGRGYGKLHFYSGDSTLISSTVAIEPISQTPPNTFQLGFNYPNPFNGATVIGYSLSVNRSVTLKIYDILGQQVRTLVEARQPPGNYTVTWDGRNEAGNLLGSGIYIYRLTAGAFGAARKMLLVR